MKRLQHKETILGIEFTHVGELEWSGRIGNIGLVLQEIPFANSINDMRSWRYRCTLYNAISLKEKDYIKIAPLYEDVEAAVLQSVILIYEDIAYLKRCVVGLEEQLKLLPSEMIDTLNIKDILE